MKMPDGHNFPPGLDIVPLHVQRSKAGKGSLDEGDAKDPQAAWIEKYGIAGRVWEAAPYLALYLTPPSYSLPHKARFSPPCSLFFDGATAPVILELGSGNGFLALDHLCRLLPNESTIVLSDLAEVLPLLEENVVAASESGNIPALVDVNVRAVQWGLREHVVQCKAALLRDGKKSITHILCSDLVYFTHLLEPLLWTLLWLTEDETQACEIEIIIGYKVRSTVKETPFWESFGRYFAFEAVADDRSNLDGDPGEEGVAHHSDDEVDDEDRLFIFLARRKPGTGLQEADKPETLRLIGGGLGGDSQFEEMLMLTSIA